MIFLILDPILALMITAIPEVQYTVLSHLLVILKRVPYLFSDDFKFFYSRFVFLIIRLLYSL